MNHTVKNVVANGIPNINNWTGPGILGGDPGLQLTVSGGVPSDGYVDTAEMDSVRTDMLWGSYRASMKLSPIAGTCSAFFWVSFKSVRKYRTASLELFKLSYRLT